ncbi:MAG TPA: glycosyltransferase family 2 protein [Candidatus Sulfotelmatobacter sp.]|nr:glycosyltransferase family 2 protein [Candidatus Sulfotelmatobacter sp.]
MKWAFWIATILIAYTYVGYAAWLRLRALWASRTVRRRACQPSLSIVMVVRNEEEILPGKLSNLLELDYPAERCEIIVVSDGSTDGTEGILGEHRPNPRLKFKINPVAQGKAAGLNDAVEMARGEVIVFTDARQKIEAGAVRLLAENFADPEVGCASGELMLGDVSGEETMGPGLYWKIEKKIRQLESAAGSVVGATGALYAVRHGLLVPVPPGTILDDVYLPMHVVRLGARVVFDERARAWDRPNLGTRREFGRKVRTLTGNYQLVQLAPWLMTFQNPLWLEFISHKLLRLLVPFALAVTLGSAFFLAGPVYRLALAVQLAFYALGLLAMVPLRKGPLNRVTDAAFTFVVLNTAAVVAFANFVTGRKPVWLR